MRSLLHHRPWDMQIRGQVGRACLFHGCLHTAVCLRWRTGAILRRVPALCHAGMLPADMYPKCFPHRAFARTGRFRLQQSHGPSGAVLTDPRTRPHPLQQERGLARSPAHAGAVDEGFVPTSRLHPGTPPHRSSQKQWKKLGPEMSPYERPAQVESSPARPTGRPSTQPFRPLDRSSRPKQSFSYRSCAAPAGRRPTPARCVSVAIPTPAHPQAQSLGFQQPLGQLVENDFLRSLLRQTETRVAASL